MANNTVTAASNPDLLNSMAAKATAEPETKPAAASITTPSDTLVYLPGGFISPTGEVIKTAEVRELTGKDEEALGKMPNQARLFQAIVDRATVSIGDLPATEDILGRLLSGDRDALLLGVYKATFGPTAELSSWCESCDEGKLVEVNINEDIDVKPLADSINDRTFTVTGRKSEYLVTLPTGNAQKTITAVVDRTPAEIATALLQECVVEIDGQPVYTPLQIQRLGVADRRTLITEISNRNPGPKFEAFELNCPDCDGKITVPMNLGSLFPF